MGILSILLTVVLIAALVGVLIWVIIQLPMPVIFRNIIIAVAAICLILWLLSMVGALPALHVR